MIRLILKVGSPKFKNSQRLNYTGGGNAGFMNHATKEFDHRPKLKSSAQLASLGGRIVFTQKKQPTQRKKEEKVLARVGFIAIN